MLRTSFGQLSQYLDFFAPSDSRFSTESTNNPLTGRFWKYVILHISNPYFYTHTALLDLQYKSSSSHLFYHPPLSCQLFSSSRDAPPSHRSDTSYGSCLLLCTAPNVWLNVFIRNVGEIFQFFRHVSWFTKHSGHSSLSIVFLTRQTPSHPDLGEGEKISLWNFNFLHECSHMNVPYFHCSRCYRINIRVRETSKSVGIRVRLCVPLSGDILVKNKTCLSFQEYNVQVWCLYE